MASFTYAANVKPYEKRKEEELAEARQRADAYAAQTGQIYDQALANQQAIANQQASAARKQYDQQFDQNAAQQLANERRLQEQMANMGLERSGYNATNQTAIALQRGRADAATRTARQAAVDAIMLNLQQYQAEAQQRQAENVLARQQALEDNAADMAYRMYTDDVSTAQNLQKYVDSHNADIYQLMYNAYNSGQAALGNEYAKQLWRLDENGVIQPWSFNTSGAAAYANRVANYQLSPRKETTPTGNDAIPSAYKTTISNFYKNISEQKTAEKKAAAIKQACDWLVGVWNYENKYGSGMSNATLLQMALLCGISESDWDAYAKAQNSSAGGN